MFRKYVATFIFLEKISELPSAGQRLSAGVRVLNDMMSIPVSKWPSLHHLTLFQLEESFLKILMCSEAKKERTACGDTPLHIACSTGNKVCVERLLLLSPEMNIQNQMGRTPLHTFLLTEVLDEVILKKLLDAGADPNVHDEIGYSSLHYLAVHDETEKTQIFARILIEYKADVNSQANLEETPLHCAIIKGREHLVEILLESGASINMHNKAEDNAMDIAFSNEIKYPRILELLSKELIISYWCRCSVNSEDLEQVLENETSRIFNKKCENEIEQLRSTYVGDSTATYYQILVSSTHTVARLLFNTDTLDSLLEFDLGQSIFGSRLKKKFEAALKRHRAIKLGIVAAKNIFSSLPDVCIYELIKYLEINDCVDLDKACSFES